MKTILCPVDFSQSSILAAEWATLIAIKKNWKLVLLNNFMIFSEEQLAHHPDSTDPFGDAKKETEEKLNQLSKELCLKFKADNLNCRVVADYSFEIENVISKAVESLEVDLVVMGTTGADRLSDVLFGSNTSHVVSNVSVPVLVIPDGSVAKLPDSIVYATDFKSEDKTQLDFFFEVASLMNAKVTFLHVSNDREAMESFMFKDMVLTYVQERNLILPSIKFDMVYGTDIYTSIKEYAEQKKSGMIAVGRHKKGFWEKILKGDLTRMMTLHSFLPVLVLQKKS